MNDSKQFKYLKFQNIQPWWLKLILLMAVGIPIFSSRPALFMAEHIEKILFPGTGLIIAVPLCTFIIWLACLPSLGPAKLLDYLAAAFAIALTTVITGAVLRQMFPLFLGTRDYGDSMRLLRLYFNILAVFPYSLTFINSFNVSDLINRFSRIHGRFRLPGLHLALTVRVFQHVGEVISRLVTIWYEENPDILLPRHRDDWNSGPVWLYHWFVWLVSCIYRWIFACIILTFEPIPVMVNEMERIYEDGEGNAED